MDEEQTQTQTQETVDPKPVATATVETSAPEEEAKPVTYKYSLPDTYVVQEGDTLLDIANRFMISYGMLADVNRFRNVARPRIFRPGIKIKLHK